MNIDNTCYQKHKVRVLGQAKYCSHHGKKQAKEYYESNKEKLEEKAWNKYQELTDEEKNIKREYARNWCRNIVVRRYRKI